jgi:predicted RNase H-like nuclease (RuvC/YqgF family)
MKKWNCLLFVMLLLSGTSFCVAPQDDYFFPTSCSQLVGASNEINQISLNNCTNELINGIRETRNSFGRANKESGENRKSIENLNSELMQLKKDRSEYDKSKDLEIEQLKKRIVVLETALAELKNEIRLSRQKTTAKTQANTPR